MRQVILIFIVVFGAIFVSGNASAQLLRSSDAVAGLSTFKSDYRKRSPLPVAISFQALRNFEKMFTGTEAVWYANDDVDIAKFSASSGETMVGYGKRGSWLYTIKRYGEENLAREVRAQVKSVYFDYVISHIDEVQVPKQENSIYIIRLRDKKNFKTVRICDREMDVIGEYHE